jgi:hypothetical protein
MDHVELYKHKIDEDNLLIEYEIEGVKYFETETAIATLLIESIIFLNSFHWEEEWNKEAKDKVSLNVNCSDVFAWGCADAETLDYKDIEDLFNHFKKDNLWGSSVWCIKKRKLMPQKPVYDKIMEIGIWNLDGMELKKNF